MKSNESLNISECNLKNEILMFQIYLLKLEEQTLIKMLIGI